MEMPRLQWRKLDGMFVAHPTATDHEKRYASVRLTYDGYDGNAVELIPTQSWHWMVCWEGWFKESGFTSSKQEAADRATEMWWTCLRTDLPRDIELEIAMIVARAKILPIPNSLFAEDTAFLQSVLWHLFQVHREEIASHVQPVRNIYDQLSAELFRRREEK